MERGELSVLGSTVRHPVEHVEVFPAPAHVTEVRLSTEELTSVCPITGQPDIAAVQIAYTPGEWCVESKSLKLYLWGFRDRPTFAEALAAEIAGEIFETAQARSVTVTLSQRPRGGITISATAVRHR
jgi:7-cyano-7-deazaguanine reductase